MALPRGRAPDQAAARDEVATRHEARAASLVSYVPPAVVVPLQHAHDLRSGGQPVNQSASQPVSNW